MFPGPRGLQHGGETDFIRSEGFLNPLQVNPVKPHHGQRHLRVAKLERSSGVNQKISRELHLGKPLALFISELHVLRRGIFHAVDFMLVDSHTEFGENIRIFPANDAFLFHKALDVCEDDTGGRFRNFVGGTRAAIVRVQF